MSLQAPPLHFFLQHPSQEHCFKAPQMDYERIDNVQTGVISPSKLRLKLLGPHNHGKKGGSNSSRTSPSKLEDLQIAKDSLLSSNFEEEGSTNDLGCVSAHTSNSAQDRQTSSHLKGRECKGADAGRIKIQNKSKDVSNHVQFSTNLRTVHPVRSLEEDTDYDSGHDNASSSSFEFHKAERTLQNSILGPFSRPIPSKWNDAEKWIPSRHTLHPNLPKNIALQSQVNRQSITNWTRFTPEAAISDQRVNVGVTETNRVDSFQPTSQKFSFTSTNQNTGSAKGINGSTAQSPLNECTTFIPRDEEANQSADTTSIPAVRSVSMRDMGTEMTPMTSQEPSRTGTPMGSATPIHSSSIPSTPRRHEPTSSPVEAITDDELSKQDEHKHNKLSDKELQMKTRREIVALGVQLGKMNIAAWASKDEKENVVKASPEALSAEHLEKVEFEARAAAWEETEKSKHAARYKREEIKIQAWESHHRAKLEAEMRRIEARVDHMKSQAQEKMLNKLAIARQRSEEKKAIAESKKNQQVAKTAQQAEYIRQTGRFPTSHFLCCGFH